MRNVKLEDLKKELDIFEYAIEEAVEDIVEEVVDTANIESIADETIENQMDMTDAVRDDGVFIAETENAENEVLDMDAPIEDIFSEDNLENGESQQIQKETDKPSKKFKSVEDLEKAYNSLEKEFTKRCQKLAQLEKDIASAKMDTPEQWKAKVDKFFVETPDAKQFAREMAEEIGSDSKLRSRSDCLEVALSRVLMKRYRRPQDLATDEDFLREHILGSDFVKKAVIDGYMKDLREGKPPVLISRAGQNTVAPRNKPKTIRDAGILFQQNNK